MIIVAVEELSLLVPMQAIIAGIQIQNNPPGRIASVSVDVPVGKQPVNPLLVELDLMVTIRAVRLVGNADFQAVEVIYPPRKSVTTRRLLAG